MAPRQKQRWNSLHRAIVGIDSETSGHDLACKLVRVKDMLSDDYDVNSRTPSDNTNLHLACSQGCPELVEVLLDLAADTMADNAALETPLHHAVMSGNEKIVRMLIDECVDVEAEDENGATPLHWALQQMDMNLSMVSLLLEKGASPNAVDVEGDSPLHYAAREGNVEGVDMLLKAGANPLIANHDGMTAFHSACFVEQTQVVKRLIQLGAPFATTMPSKDHCLTPLHLCANGRSTSIFDLLLAEHEGSLDVRDAYARTPLHLAAKLGNETYTKRLVGEGASIEAVDVFGRTPPQTTPFTDELAMAAGDTLSL